MMNVIKQNALSYRMHYPIGESIQSNFKVIGAISEYIQTQIENLNINLWCRGSSGAIIAGIVASQLTGKKDVQIKHVKKHGEFAHWTHVRMDISRQEVINIIVDDFIESGDTIIAILDKFNEVTDSKIKMDYVIVSDGIYDHVAERLTPRVHNLVCGK